MKSFGLTMAFAILVSLVVSFTLTPMLGTMAEGERTRQGQNSSKDSPVFHAVDVSTHVCWSGRCATARLRDRRMLVLLSSIPLFMVVPKNFMPQDDQSEFEISLRAPEGTSLEASEVLTNRVATAVRQQVPEVDYTLVSIGGDQAATRNLSSIYVRLKPIEQRKRDQFVIMNAIRADILPVVAKDARTSVSQVASIGGGGSQNAEISFLIRGPDLRKLDVLSQQLLEKMKTMPGVVDPDRSLNSGKPELSVQIDRPKAADLSVQVGDAAEALRWLVGGDQVTTYNEGSEQYRSAPSRPG